MLHDEHIVAWSQNLVTLIFWQNNFLAMREYQPYGAHSVKFSYG